MQSYENKKCVQRRKQNSIKEKSVFFIFEKISWVMEYLAY